MVDGHGSTLGSAEERVTVDLGRGTAADAATAHPLLCRGVHLGIEGRELLGARDGRAIDLVGRDHLVEEACVRARRRARRAPR